MKEKVKNQILFDSYKEIYDEEKEAREMGTKACIGIWNSSGPSELKLKYVVEHKDTSKEEISHIE
jgi:hypothetical protein